MPAARQIQRWCAVRWILPCLALMVTCWPCAVRAERGGVLRCGWYLWDPYQYTYDDHGTKRLTGLDVQLVRGICAGMGYEVAYDPVSWKQHQLDIKSGARDIAAGAFWNADRASYAYYSAPYRMETDVLYVRRRDAARFRFRDAEDLARVLGARSARLGIIDGFYYGPVMMNYIEDPANADRIVRVGDDVENFENLLAGKIDAFVIDRLVGATLAWRHRWQTEVVQLDRPVYAEAIHVLFSKKSTTPEMVEAFNRSLDELRSSGTYNRTVREYLLPVLLGVTSGQRWFFIVDIIGTIAFAVSGVLLARAGHYSLFGALVLASLPAVGGGIMRDVIINRERPAVLTTPAYLLAILLTVTAGYFLFKLQARRRARWASESSGEDEERMLLGRISNNTAVAFFDALGLSAFTVIGVIVAVEARCQPLWLWGPLLAALTGAGGGIVRDVIRADADNPGLKGSFYAEVALIWGFIFSVFLTWYANFLDYRPAHITLAVVVVLLGGLFTRMLVFRLRIRSPMY